MSNYISLGPGDRTLAMHALVQWVMDDDGISWHFENMWALAWTLGLDPPPDGSGQMTAAVIRPLMTFVASLDEQADDSRSEVHVKSLEDFFYCLHNAVRSAQLGHASCVPPGFHPVGDGGAIHERVTL